MTLAQYFAVEIDAFAILSKHFHSVLPFDPNSARLWSDEAVAERWVNAFPPKHQGKASADLKSLKKTTTA